ncbi:hypothetical protein [Pseudomonas protegens]|uniref:hypothetical protein n=1 Tax=Pseudomonas protegens TaxID=380021 RepID=UPI0037F8169D
MTLFQFYSELREETLKLISGVKNSNGYYSWDNTTPNYTLKFYIERLLNQYILLAREVGVYVVTRYAGCSNPKHHDYPTQNRYGLSIEYQDKKYFWPGSQLYQGKRLSVCPCSPENTQGENYVIDDFVYRLEADAKICDRIVEIFEDFSHAIDRCGDNKSRSGIREYLLRALLRINDSVLPQTVNEYIEFAKSQQKDMSS